MAVGIFRGVAVGIFRGVAVGIFRGVDVKTARGVAVGEERSADTATLAREGMDVASGWSDEPDPPEKT